MNNPPTVSPKVYLRISEPSRHQVEMNMCALDDLLPKEHKARLIWAFVQQMDTNACFRKIKSTLNAPGRPATNPEVLFALWLLAITDGITSGRQVTELCELHNAYKWLAGGVPINRNMVCAFRSGDPLLFEELLTSSLAVLRQQDLLGDEDLAQDGTKIKAAAGYNSFRRKPTLERYQEEAKKYLQSIKRENQLDPHAMTKKKKAAQERAARERAERLDKAVSEIEKAQEIKSKSCRKKKSEIAKEVKKVRVSTTDPEARKMKMGDGGYRLALNVQYATGCKSRVIFAVSVGNTMDPGTASPLMARALSRRQKLELPAPTHWICDSGYATTTDIEDCTTLYPQCRYVAASKLIKNSDPTKPKRNDSDAVKEWRQFISSEEYKEVYSQRCSVAEFANAQTKNHGFREFRLRGLLKAKGEALLHTIAYNIQRSWNLCNQIA